MGFESYDHDCRIDEDERMLIAEIQSFISDYIADDENGESPDEDAIIEGMGFSDDKCGLVRKAYELYWNR